MVSSEKTIKIYANCLKKMNDLNIKYDYIHTCDINDVKNIINDIKNIKNTKGESISNAFIKHYISAIIWYYNEKNINIDKTLFLQELSRIRKNTNDKYHDNKLSAKEKKVYLEWNEIIEVYKKLYEKRTDNFTASKKCITISLYVLFPPRRALDYSKMVVKNNTDNLSDDENYYIINPPLFIFNIFKEKDTCDKIFDVPVNLCILLNEYIEKYNLYDKKLLDISENELSSKIIKIMEANTGKKASINTFRHSYISYMQHEGHIKSTKQKKELASKMGHSYRTQQDIYVKNLSDDYN